MEKQYAFEKYKGKKIKNLKKLLTSQKQTLISVEIDTRMHFLHYNAGKYVK